MVENGEKLPIFHQQVELYHLLIHLADLLILSSTGWYQMLLTTLFNQGEKCMRPLIHRDTETLQLPIVLC